MNLPSISGLTNQKQILLSREQQPHPRSDDNERIIGWVRFASPFARRLKPCLSGEMRMRLQDSWHTTYKMDI
jgi:hypothetical protein